MVIAHEYGHHESQHIWKGLAWYGLLSLPILFVVARVARRWGGLYQPRAVPVALFTLVAASLVVQPFDNLLTRRMEMEADWVALETTRDPDAARELFEEFADDGAPGARPARVGAPLLRHAPVDRRPHRRGNRLGGRRGGKHARRRRSARQARGRSGGATCPRRP